MDEVDEALEVLDEDDNEGDLDRSLESTVDVAENCVA